LMLTIKNTKVQYSIYDLYFQVNQNIFSFMFLKTYFAPAVAPTPGFSNL